MSLYSKIWISKWEPIGPAPILREGGSIWHVTGRIEATAPHPTNANVVYAQGPVGEFGRPQTPPHLLQVGFH